MPWTIETKVLPLFGGISGHMYLEIFNPEGKRIAQVHGLATSARTGNPKSIGSKGDILRAFAGTQFLLSGTQSVGRDAHPHKGHVLFSGSAEDIKIAVEAINAVKDSVNGNKIPYILLSQNSNSVFMLMVEEIGKRIEIDKTALEKTLKQAALFPGVANKHLKEVFNKDSLKKDDKPVKPQSRRYPKP